MRRTFRLYASSCSALLCLFALGCTVSTSSTEADAKKELEALSYKIEGADPGCIDEHVFSNRSDLCIGLTDESLNKVCTLEGRRLRYQEKCGNDFESRNVSPMVITGWDPRLARNCDMAPAGVAAFPRLAEYCDYLKDERRHQSCHWASRIEEFRVWQCPGNFSPMPQF